MHIGKRIKYFRGLIKPKMSQAELAYRAFNIDNYIDAQNKLKYVEAQEDISVKDLSKIAEVLRIRSEDFQHNNTHPTLLDRISKPYPREKISFKK